MGRTLQSLISRARIARVFLAVAFAGVFAAGSGRARVAPETDIHKECGRLPVTGAKVKSGDLIRARVGSRSAVGSWAAPKANSRNELTRLLADRNGVRCGVHSQVQNVRGRAQDVLKMRGMLSRLFVKAGWDVALLRSTVSI
jgi:hypothetical protein